MFRTVTAFISGNFLYPVLFPFPFAWTTTTGLNELPLHFQWLYWTNGTKKNNPHRHTHADWLRVSQLTCSMLLTWIHHSQLYNVICWLAHHSQKGQATPFKAEVYGSRFLEGHIHPTRFRSLSPSTLPIQVISSSASSEEVGWRSWSFESDVLEQRDI